jgi:Spy/CpxP family protein refolding chaperone
MTQPLPRKLFGDRSKLSGQMFALTLSLLVTAVAPNNVGIAQAKDTSAKNTAPKSSTKEAESVPPFTHRPPSHGCTPPGPPPFGFMVGPQGPPGVVPPPMALPLSGVDLSDEQIEKLAQLNTAFMEQTGPVIFKLHALEAQFRLALSSSNLNMDDVNSLRSKIASQRVQVDSAAGDYAIAQAQSLTPEQRHQIKLDLERFELNHSFGPHLGPPE